MTKNSRSAAREKSKERQLTEGEVDALTGISGRMDSWSPHMVGIAEIAPWTLAHEETAHQ